MGRYTSAFATFEGLEMSPTLILPNAAQVAQLLQGVPDDTLAKLAERTGVDAEVLAALREGGAGILEAVSRLVPAVVEFRKAALMPLPYMQDRCPCCGRAD